MGVYSNRKRSEDPFCKSPNFDLPNFNHISKKLKVTRSVDRPPNSSVSRFGLYPQPKQDFRGAVHAPVKSNRFGFSKRRWSCCGKYMGTSFSAFNSKPSRDSVQTTRDVHFREGQDVRNSYWNSVSVLRTKLGKESLKTIRSGDFREDEDVGKAISNLFGIWKSKARRESSKTIRDVDFREGEDGDERRERRESWRDKGKGKEVIVLDGEITQEDVTEGSSIEEMEIVKKHPVRGKRGMGNIKASISNIEDSGLKTVSSSVESNKLGKIPHELLLDNVKKRDETLKELGFNIQLKERLLHRHHLLRPQKKVEAVKEDVVREAFMPLSDEDKSEIMRAFANSNRRKILVSHEKSNIDITGEALQCLKPRAWLNDEVINLYLELLKERENREPHKFLKCHFLNTFFYKKLIGGKAGYNYQAVKRWTTQRKLGYCLSDCDKIFVPIHQEVHWCLGIINKKDQKFQYLDSLGGKDHKVMKALAMYYVDEVKDKTGKDIDVDSWGQEFVEDLPEQENGYDCGVFMIKYADFYSRGVGLHFKQEHMPYFRLRTANEILKLKAE